MTMQPVNEKALRESFESQLAVLSNGQIPYPEIFNENEGLKEDLFREYCGLDYEPDWGAYSNYRMQQEGFTDREMLDEISENTPVSTSKVHSMAPLVNRGEKELHSEKIFHEFNDYVIAEKMHKMSPGSKEAGDTIPEEFRRPQLAKADTIGRMKELGIWREDLVLFILDGKNLDTLLPVLIKRVIGILGQMSFGFRWFLPDYVIHDDLSEDVSTRFHLKNPDHAYPDMEVSTRQRSWRNCRVSLQEEVKEFHRKLEVHPRGYIERNRGAIMVKCAEEGNDGDYLVESLLDILSKLEEYRLDENETKKVIDETLANSDTQHVAIIEDYLRKALDNDRSYNEARTYLIQKYNREHCMNIPIRLIEKEILRKLIDAEINNDDVIAAESSIPVRTDNDLPSNKRSYGALNGNERSALSQAPPKPELTLREVALKCVYEGVVVSRSNANQIAREHGHTSGDKLYQRFCWYSVSGNRIAMPNQETLKTLNNKIERFEKVIELLSESSRKRAVSELSTLQSLRAKFEE